jgi:wyosine [tRNA(Phe)-imidazoG37] synthetase (radical SAM superfamily)
MKYIFGPVPSRRLGSSLGIDPIPLKTCNWNCVYCQLGRTIPLTNERKEYVPRREIVAEVRQALSMQPPGAIDWVTFVGSGEPTLHSGLGRLIREVKTLTNLPIAVITNGALLYLPEVREELALADAVLPSLDAGNSRLYLKVNRPWPKLTFDRLLEGLIAFRQEYPGQLWVEVMLVKDLNDSEDALQEIASALELIHPNQVHLNQPVRPPCESWVQPLDKSGMERAQAILGAVVPMVSPEHIRSVVASSNDLESTILSVITRHPMHEEELCVTLRRWSTSEVHHALQALQAVQKAQVIDRFGQRFWSAAAAYYAGDGHLKGGGEK